MRKLIFIAIATVFAVGIQYSAPEPVEARALSCQYFWGSVCEECGSRMVHRIPCDPSGGGGVCTPC